MDQGGGRSDSDICHLQSLQELQRGVEEGQVKAALGLSGQGRRHLAHVPAGHNRTQSLSVPC